MAYSSASSPLSRIQMAGPNGTHSQPIELARYAILELEKIEIIGRMQIFDRIMIKILGIGDRAR
jgi:hypothetical protein